jgi:hypothetical protein
MKIDCHCHADAGAGLTDPWDTRTSLEKYMQRVAKAGIDRTVLLVAFHTNYRVANREVGQYRGQSARSFSECQCTT